MAWSLLCGAWAPPAAPVLQGRGGPATSSWRTSAQEPYPSPSLALREACSWWSLFPVLEKDAWKLMELSYGHRVGPEAHALSPRDGCIPWGLWGPEGMGQTPAAGEVTWGWSERLPSSFPHRLPARLPGPAFVGGVGLATFGVFMAGGWRASKAQSCGVEAPGLAPLFARCRAEASQAWGRDKPGPVLLPCSDGPGSWAWAWKYCFGCPSSSRGGHAPGQRWRGWVWTLRNLVSGLWLVCAGVHAGSPCSLSSQCLWVLGKVGGEALPSADPLVCGV